MKHHPDKNPGKEEEAKQKFMVIANAYDILSDEEKRKIYDQHGAEGVRQHQANSNQGAGNPFMGGGNFDDFFGNFFHGGSGGGGGGGSHFQFNFGGGDPFGNFGGGGHHQFFE